MYYKAYSVPRGSYIPELTDRYVDGADGSLYTDTLGIVASSNGDPYILSKHKVNPQNPKNSMNVRNNNSLSPKANV